MKITRKQLDTIREMTTDQLKGMINLKALENTDEFLFVECVKYELSARYHNVQCDCDDCYRADGFEIVE